MLSAINSFRLDSEAASQGEVALGQALASVAQPGVVKEVLEACGRRILRNNGHDRLTFCGDPPEG